MEDWAQTFDATRAKVHIVNEGHFAEIYKARNLVAIAFTRTLSGPEARVILTEHRTII